MAANFKPTIVDVQIDADGHITGWHPELRTRHCRGQQNGTRCQRSPGHTGPCLAVNGEDGLWVLRTDRGYPMDENELAFFRRLPELIDAEADLLIAATDWDQVPS